MGRKMTVLILLGGLVLVLPPRNVNAAQITDVADAFDGDDVFDANVSVSFFQNYRWAKVTKEFYDTTLGIADGRDLRITETGNHMVIDIELGLYKDLSFNVSLPVSFTEKYGAKFADGVTATNSELYSSWFVGDLGKQPFSSEHAMGIGDMHLGLKWAPFNCERHNEKWWPTWMLYYDVMLPSGSPWDPSKDFYNRFTTSAKKTGIGVGSGNVEMTFGTALSRRFKYFDPYMGFHYTLPILTSRSKINGLVARAMRNNEYYYESKSSTYMRDPDYDDDKYFGRMYDDNDPNKANADPYPSDYDVANDYPHGKPTGCDPRNPSTCEWSDGQIKAMKDNILLPHHFGLVFGTEIIPWEVPDKHQKLAINLNLAAEMFTEGITLNELSDLLNRPTYCEQYTHFEGTFGISIQAAKYVRFNTSVTFGHDTQHFLTYADEASNRYKGPSGEDLPDAYFDKRLDSVGRRVRVAETFLFTWLVTGSVLF
ncbi:MAG: hypothetical protein GXP49_11395 [Deltaproteobacteria bacterium]|nr:hypothetical protein [Deltaproteobacteria bacterium]